PDGKLEPFEEVMIDIPEKFSGVVIEKMSRRKGQLLDLKNKNGQSRLLFEIPTRGLLGYRTEFVVDTRGEGILYSRLIGFKPQIGAIEYSETGSMVSMISGKVSAFALWNLQERGVIYIQPNVTVYEGQVIGNVSKGNDLAVNPVKGKKLSNVRASGSDEAINLTPPWELDLERGLSIIKNDEFLEITPTNIRLRKQLLTEVERVRAARKA
ncbi:MAG: translational GTPase TypA, partial [Patescibacteria group bacterium]